MTLNVIHTGSDIGRRDTIDNNNGPDKPKGFGKRHIQIILCFFGMAITFGMRTNMSVAIVAMTNDTVNPSFEHYYWTESERGLILSSNNWGFAITPVIGGIVAKTYGPKWPLLVAVTASCSLTMFTSVVAAFGWEYTCVLRLFQGGAQGFINPSIHTLMSKWLHPSERGYASMVYAGGISGIVITMTLSGLIASSPMGWPAIFYFSGGIGFVWIVFFYIFCTNTPAEYTSISMAEKQFIESMPGSSKEKLPIPWTKMWLSKACWAIVFGQMAQNWGFVTLMSNVPSYFDGILHLDIEMNALYSTIPYVLMIVMILLSSNLSSYLMAGKYMTTGHLRKLFNTIGMWMPMICLTALGTIENDEYSAVTLLTIGIGASGCVFAGCLINQMDLTPNFAGPLMGMGQTLGNVMSIFGPLFVGYVVTDITDPSLWNIAFLTIGGIYFIGGLIYVVFGSGEIQDFNNVKKM